MNNILVSDDGSFFDASFNDSSLTIGAPRFLGDNKNPTVFVATLNDLHQEQITIGMYNTRREAIGELLNWAKQLTSILESQAASDWIFDNEQ